MDGTSPILPPASPPPMAPMGQPAKSARWPLLVLGSIIVLVGIIFVATRGTLISPLASPEMPDTPRKTPIPPVTAEQLDNEIANQIKTTSPGKTVPDIDQDISNTDTTAIDQELEALNQGIKDL